MADERAMPPQREMPSRLDPAHVTPPDDATTADLHAGLRAASGADLRSRVRELAARYAALSDLLPRIVATDAAVITSSHDILAALASSVRAYGVALRRAGAAPEHALVLVKAAVREGAPPHGGREHALMQRVARWFVEGYYAR